MIPLTVAIAISRAEQLAPGCTVIIADDPGGSPWWHIIVRDVRPEYAPALIAAEFKPLYSHANGTLTTDRSLAAHYVGTGKWCLRLPR